MKLLACTPTIHQYATCREFLADFAIGEDDLVLSNAHIVMPFLEASGCRAQTLFLSDHGRGEPTDVMVDSLLEAASRRSFRRLVAVGGGSIIDVAKLVAVAPAGSRSEDIFTSKTLRQEKELIILPTTCGTGSEVTNISVITRTRLGIKLGFVHDCLYPRHAVLVPELLADLPYKAFAASSLDALVHAVESFLSPAATPFTRPFSVEAIRLILSGYARLVRQGKDDLRPLLGDFLLASTQAGLAFGTAGCATVHAMSSALASTCHVPHGESNYALFAGILRHYEQHQVSALTALQDILARELDCAPAEALPRLDALLQEVLPLKPLSAYGMEPGQARSFAEAVFQTQQRLLGNSPKKMNIDEMSAIYSALL